MERLEGRTPGHKSLELFMPWKLSNLESRKEGQKSGKQEISAFNY